MGLLVINLACILYFFRNPGVDFVSMFLVLVISTLQIKVLMYLWLSSEFDLVGRKTEPAYTLWIFLACMGLFMVPMFFYLCELSVDTGPVWMFGTWVVTSIVGSILLLRSTVIMAMVRSEKPDSENEAFFEHSFRQVFKPYPFFMVFWVFSIGFLPGYVIFQKVYQSERVNWLASMELFEKPDSDSSSQDREKSDQRKAFWDWYAGERRSFFDS
jgi:hypothetical protein